MRWGSGGGIDLIMLHTLPFWLISGFLQSQREPRVCVLTPSASNHISGSHFECIWRIPLGGTVEAVVTFGILVHFSLPAEPICQPGEHEE